MLHEFLEAHRGELLDRIRTKLENDRETPPTKSEIEDIVIAFFDVLLQQLRRTAGVESAELEPVEHAATPHGAELQALRVPVPHVVHDYGSVCSAVTEVAAQRGVTIAPEEFHCLNVTLDNAMAAAIAEYHRADEVDRSRNEERELDLVAMTLRNLTTSAVFAYEALKRSGLGPDSRTGEVLGRSLQRQRELAEAIHKRVKSRMIRTPETVRFPIRMLLEEATAVAKGHLGSKAPDIRIDRAPDRSMEGDRTRLVSGIAGLIENAVGQPGSGDVRLVASIEGDEVRIEVDDEAHALTTIVLPARKAA